MKEKPILFSGPMVRAILEGRKTQTRRVVKNQNLIKLSPNDDKTPMIDAVNMTDAMWRKVEKEKPPHFDHLYFCPYGQPGNRLWVRETHSIVPRTAYWHTPETPHRENGDHWSVYREGWDRSAPSWKPSIHMPRWASRITLEVTGVRVERLQDITSQDAQHEGTEPSREAFQYLWESINGPESWDSNPWVWVVDFKKI